MWATLNCPQCSNASTRPAVLCRGNIARNVRLFHEGWKKQAKSSSTFICEQILTCTLRVWEAWDRVQDLQHTNRAALQAAYLHYHLRCSYRESLHWSPSCQLRTFRVERRFVTSVQRARKEIKCKAKYKNWVRMRCSDVKIACFFFFLNSVNLSLEVNHLPGIYHKKYRISLTG